MNTNPRISHGAAAIGFAMVLAACGGATSADQAGLATQTSTEQAPDLTTPPEPDAVEQSATTPPESEPATPAAPAEEVAAQPEEPAAEPPAGENQLPDVNVIDLATGAEVNLSSFAPSETPIILWFWAPH